MASIALDVVDQLVCDLAFAEAITSHLRLDDDLLPLQDEVDSGRGTRPGRTRVLGADIVEEVAQY